ncbi:hypothetical protein J6590_043314 [Homalodisca vitripennis]|nr:hypothetical protein J6590_043314 [Homalodisca vitripennis]
MLAPPHSAQRACLPCMTHGAGAVTQSVTRFPPTKPNKLCDAISSDPTDTSVFSRRCAAYGSDSGRVWILAGRSESSARTLTVLIVGLPIQLSTVSGYPSSHRLCRATHPVIDCVGLPIQSSTVSGYPSSHRLWRATHPVIDCVGLPIQSSTNYSEATARWTDLNLTV